MPLKPTLLQPTALLALASGLAVAACAGASTTPESAESESSPPPPGPGGECLEAATAERTPSADAPDKIGVSHILIRHNDLDRDATELSREEACLRALEALEKLKSGGDFDEVASEYSDERGVDTRGASLGTVGRDEVHESFANAAWSLEVDELSYVVESKSGFHIILRTE